jgi:U3 small nucleolar RNA-associated protein 14
MAKTLDKKRQEGQFKQKLRTLIGCVTHTQNIADQAMELAKSLMTDEEQNDSDTLRVIENLSCVCEEALEMLYEELRKGTRLHEIICDKEMDTFSEIVQKAMRDL